jgi:hypothetical protein
MSQSFWESEPVEEQQAAVQEPEVASELQEDEMLESEAVEIDGENELVENDLSELELPEEELKDPEDLDPSLDDADEGFEPPVVEKAPEVLSLSVDEFGALEERVLRAVNLVKRERLARSEAEERAAQAEVHLRDQAPLVDRLQAEVHTLRTERDQVRQRVERLLTQLDALEL